MRDGFCLRYKQIFCGLTRFIKSLYRIISKIPLLRTNRSVHKPSPVRQGDLMRPIRFGTSDSEHNKLSFKTAHTTNNVFNIPGYQTSPQTALHPLLGTDVEKLDVNSVDRVCYGSCVSSATRPQRGRAIREREKRGG